MKIVYLILTLICLNIIIKEINRKIRRLNFMDIFIARQPIFTKNQKVYGYEILYRESSENKFNNVEPDKATTNVLLNTFETFGLETLTNDKYAFINFTENLLKEDVVDLFPKKYLVVELKLSILEKSDSLKHIKVLKDKNYIISIDDFSTDFNMDLISKYADIIKIDFYKFEKEEIEEISSLLKNKDVKLLAEKLETQEDFELAKNLGFDLFQGFFFKEPEILLTQDLAPLKISYLQLLIKLNEDDLDLIELSNIVSRDLGLTYRLLKMVNTLSFSLRREVDSVKDALILLGERKTRKWISLIVLTELSNDRPEELVRTSLVRAKFAELLALKTHLEDKSDVLFLSGLFSLIDVILRRPLDKILEELNISKEVKNSLLDKDDNLYRFLSLIISYEKGNWDEVASYTNEFNIENQDISDCYMNSLAWYLKIL